MRRLAALLIAIAVWFVPIPAGIAGAQGLRSDEGSYRMRMCELALFSGESPLHDQFLEWRRGQDVPYGAFAPAASAFVLSRLLPSAAIDVQAGTLDEDALADGAWRLMIVLTWISALCLVLASSKFALGGPPPASSDPWAVVPALAVALAWSVLALAPACDGGSVRSGPWAMLLGAAVLGGAALLARPRELGDQIGLAIGIGVLAGLALANDPFAWPTLLAPLVALGLSLRGQDAALRRNALRTGLFFIATTLIVSMLRTPGPPGASPWPRFEFPLREHAHSVADFVLDGGCIALIAWLILGGPARSERRLLSVMLVLGFALRSIDSRYGQAPLAAAGCALVAWLCAPAAPGRRRLSQPLMAFGIVALLLAAAASGRPGLHSAETIGALRELRSTTSSSGAWNHPLAQQEYAILANPDMAGTLVFHARRPACAALLPGARIEAGAGRAAAALLCESSDALAERARELGASYVIVAGRDLRQLDELVALSGTAATSVVRAEGLRELLLRAALPGFQQVSRVPSPADPDGPAELVVWRLSRPPETSDLPKMRAR